MNPPDLIGTTEASRILNVNPATLWRWTKSERLIPALRVEGRPLFDRAEIEALAESRAA